jgi:hypothetical protein
MNFDHQLEIGDAHLVKDCIAQNAGIVDNAVELAEMIERRLHYGRSGGGFSYRVEVRHRRATFLADQLHYLLGRTDTLAAAVGGAAEIIDDYLGAFGGGKQCDLTANAAPCAGYDRRLAVQRRAIRHLASPCRTNSRRVTFDNARRSSKYPLLKNSIGEAVICFS